MSKGPSQLELGLPVSRDPDRNFQKGGRSFYFFDLDDNVLHLPTPIFIYNKHTGQEIAVTTGNFAHIFPLLGKEGEYENFFVNPDDSTGSFRRFRDHQTSTQPFIEDIARALEQPDFKWKGPSWDCFHYAVFNQRPVSLITARGHHPDTIRRGICHLVDAKFLPCEPNYLDIFPVSFPPLKQKLGGGRKASTAELKKNAIIQCVENAMEKYGANIHHRFGMSDDDPQNILLITEAKRILKAKYPQNSFYVIHADKKPFIKVEIFCDRTETVQISGFEQPDFFE